MFNVKNYFGEGLRINFSRTGGSSVTMVLIVLCSLTASTKVYSQVDSVSSNDLYRFADGVIFTYSQPFRWKQKDWITLGVVIAGTGAISLMDEPISKFWKDVDSPVLDKIERVGFHYGKPYSAFIVTGGFYLTGLIFKDKWARDTGIQLGVTLLTSGLLQTLQKDAIGRARPGTNVGAYDFKPFSKSAAYHSFPSGHASVAFGISLVLAQRVQSVPLKIFFYSLAASTTMARLYTEAHWLSDITFGATIGWFCAQTAIDRINTNAKRIKESGLRSAWNVYPSPTGISIVGKF